MRVLSKGILAVWILILAVLVTAFAMDCAAVCHRRDVTMPVDTGFGLQASGSGPGW